MKRALGVLILAIGTTPAEAHLVTSGLGPFYDGALHVLVSPGDVLAIISLALCAGLRGPAHGRVALLGLPLFWTAGLFLAPHVSVPWVEEAKAVIILALGALAALDRALSTAATVILAAFAGSLFGVSSEASAAATLPLVAGLVGTIGLTLALLLGLVLATTARLGPMPARIAGSWTAATGLLMAGWALRSAAGGILGP